MSLAIRSYEKELLDRDGISFKEILGTMEELNVINTLLGGHNITRKGVRFFLSRMTPGQSVSIAEIGCGGGDNLSAINKFLEEKKQHAQFIGIDIKEECIQFAEERNKFDARWICSDYKQVNWPDGKPDIIFSSLFCHHFTDEQLVLQLKWLRENSRLGFFINDLHRNAIAYYSIKWLAHFFSRSALVKNDAPLSVKRGFKKAEWQRLLGAAGIGHYTIKWQWAFRYLICVPNDN